MSYCETCNSNECDILFHELRKVEVENAQLQAALTAAQDRARVAEEERDEWKARYAQFNPADEKIAALLVRVAELEAELTEQRAWCAGGHGSPYSE